MKPDADEFIPRFTQDDVLQRFVFLAERCDVYLDAVNSAHPTWRLGFDHLVLLNVAQSALDDIWRYKIYHLRSQNKRSDAVKRAAFFTKWITRFRPLYFQRILPAGDADSVKPDADVDKQDTSLFINEGFAIHVSLVTLATDLDTDKIHLDPEYFANLLYDLHYRNITEDALLHIYDNVRCLSRGESLILR